MMHGANVPIPALLQGNKRDKRGYPIPYIVYRDRKGKPQFTVNDAKLVRRCLFHNRCGLCGQKMGDVIYFVGGPAAAFHENGAFIDPPMHRECAEYALQVCPFIAMRNYKGYQPNQVIDKLQPRDGTMIVADEEAEQMKGKPDIFVLLGTKGFVNMGEHHAPRLVKTNVESLEFWKDGVRLDEEKPEDDAVIRAAIDKSLGVVQGMQDGATVVKAPARSPMATSARSVGRGLGVQALGFTFEDRRNAKAD